MTTRPTVTLVEAAGLRGALVNTANSDWRKELISVLQKQVELVQIFPCRSEAGFCQAMARRYARDFYASSVSALGEFTCPRIQTRILKPGDVSFVHHCHGGYRLPNGLAEQTRVTVSETDVGYAQVTDATGNSWHVSFSCLETPCSVWWNGEWIDRFTHRDGDAAYAHARAHADAERQTRGVLYTLTAT